MDLCKQKYRKLFSYKNEDTYERWHLSSYFITQLFLFIYFDRVIYADILLSLSTLEIGVLSKLSSTCWSPKMLWNTFLYIYIYFFFLQEHI